MGYQEFVGLDTKGWNNHLIGGTIDIGVEVSDGGFNIGQVWQRVNKSQKIVSYQKERLVLLWLFSAFFEGLVVGCLPQTRASGQVWSW